MRAPEFWQHDGPLPRLLSPLGAAYSAGAWLRERVTTPYRAPYPVLCVGNLTVGGGGKTPTVRLLAIRLQEQGARVVVLSKGYGGALTGPVLVNPAAHDAEAVGDEPLLHAQATPTVIAKRRVEGLRFAAGLKPDLVLMDDGLQNPTVHKHAALIVVNGADRFGNARVLPAGPLREPLGRGLRRASAFLVIDGPAQAIMAPRGVPVFTARTVLKAQRGEWAGRTVVGFAGIANPLRFFHSLHAIGANVVDFIAYSDHYCYQDDDYRRLRARAAAHNARLITTEKDFVRLPLSWRKGLFHLQISLELAEADLFDQWLRNYFIAQT